LVSINYLFNDKIIRNGIIKESSKSITTRTYVDIQKRKKNR